VLTVEHAGQTATYRASKEALSFVAFDAGCRHHVRLVTSGYRVVLTYNLLLRGDPVAAATSRTDPGCENAVTMAAAWSSWQRIWQQRGPSWQQCRWGPGEDGGVRLRPAGARAESASAPSR
jgi:hypothetical protein